MNTNAITTLSFDELKLVAGGVSDLSGYDLSLESVESIYVGEPMEDAAAKIARRKTA